VKRLSFFKYRIRLNSKGPFNNMTIYDILKRNVSSRRTL